MELESSAGGPLSAPPRESERSCSSQWVNTSISRDYLLLPANICSLEHIQQVQAQHSLTHTQIRTAGQQSRTWGHFSTTRSGQRQRFGLWADRGADWRCWQHPGGVPHPQPTPEMDTAQQRGLNDTKKPASKKCSQRTVKL